MFNQTLQRNQTKCNWNFTSPYRILLDNIFAALVSLVTPFCLTTWLRPSLKPCGHCQIMVLTSKNTTGFVNDLNALFLWYTIPKGKSQQVYTTYILRKISKLWKVARIEPCQANVIHLHPYPISLYRSQTVRHNDVSNKYFGQLHSLGGKRFDHVNSHLETQPKWPCLKVILIWHSLIGNFHSFYYLTKS